MCVCSGILSLFLIHGISVVIGKERLQPMTKIVFHDEDGIVGKRDINFEPGDESEYYFFTEDEQPELKSPTEGIPGEAPPTYSCHIVRSVPSTMRFPYIARGIPNFYDKYTEAYGIPIVSSSGVSDDALKRACYVTRFLLSGNKDVRNSFYKRSGRVAVIGYDMDALAIPEHSHVPDYWKWKKLRGLGATIYSPVSSAGEENLLCYKHIDEYKNEDMLLHEMAHGIHNLGAKYALNGWHERLNNQFSAVRKSALWDDTHAKSSVFEYFAEGVQSYFNGNDFSDPPNGMHGTIDTREKLKTYDPVLYRLIQEVFPCKNDYIPRCNSDRASELAQVFQMNCLPDCGIDGNDDCKDDEIIQCPLWAERDECAKNPVYMLDHCRKSCRGNKGQFNRDNNRSGCLDTNYKCQMLAAKGRCTVSPLVMMMTCKKSCNRCG